MNKLTKDRGGVSVGPSHEAGGIKVKVGGQTNVEIEGGEGVINKAAMQSNKKVKLGNKSMTICEAASHLNQTTGGVKYDCNSVDAEIKQFMRQGGRVLKPKKKRYGNQIGHIEDYDYVLRKPFKNLIADLAKIESVDNDLCLHGFCPDNLGIERKAMPQIKREMYSDYVKWLRDTHGIETSDPKAVKAGKLKPTQSNIYADKVKKILLTWDATPVENNPIADKLIYVSKDNYILDGHHNWAAVNWMHPGNPVYVRVVDTDIKTLFDLTHDFPMVSYEYELGGILQHGNQDIADTLEWLREGGVVRDFDFNPGADLEKHLKVLESPISITTAAGQKTVPRYQRIEQLPPGLPLRQSGNQLRKHQGQKPLLFIGDHVVDSKAEQQYYEYLAKGGVTLSHSKAGGAAEQKLVQEKKREALQKLKQGHETELGPRGKQALRYALVTDKQNFIAQYAGHGRDADRHGKNYELLCRSYMLGPDGKQVVPRYAAKPCHEGDAVVDLRTGDTAVVKTVYYEQGGILGYELGGNVYATPNQVVDISTYEQELKTKGRDLPKVMEPLVFHELAAVVTPIAVDPDDPAAEQWPWRYKFVLYAGKPFEMTEGMFSESYLSPEQLKAEILEFYTEHEQQQDEGDKPSIRFLKSVVRDQVFGKELSVENRSGEKIMELLSREDVLAGFKAITSPDDVVIQLLDRGTAAPDDAEQQGFRVYLIPGGGEPVDGAVVVNSEQDLADIVAQIKTGLRKQVAIATLNSVDIEKDLGAIASHQGIKTKTEMQAFTKWQRLKSQPRFADIVVVLEVHDFLETYNQDADVFSKIMGTALVRTGRETVEKASGVPRYQLQSVLDKFARASEQIVVINTLGEPMTVNDAEPMDELDALCSRLRSKLDTKVLRYGGVITTVPVVTTFLQNLDRGPQDMVNADYMHALVDSLGRERLKILAKKAGHSNQSQYKYDLHQGINKVFNQSNE